MRNFVTVLFRMGVIAAMSSSVVGCSTLQMTGKIAGAPVKIVYKGGEMGVKGTYQVGKLTANGAWESGKLAGKGVYYGGKGAYEVGEFGAKGVYYTGKFAGTSVVNLVEATGVGLTKVGHGVYYLGSVPLKVTDAVLTTAETALDVTVLVVDTAGQVVELRKRIDALALSAELEALKQVPNLLEIALGSSGPQQMAAF